MPRARDQAGNIWETDAQGNPVRMIQPAGPSFPGSIPGVMGVVPPNPAMVAKDAREEARQNATDRRAEQASQLAAQAAAREQKKFESEDTMAPPPGDTTKTGEDYLATIPSALAGQVKALSEGRRAFPTGSALRSPAVQQLIAAATQFDPTLDAANSATRVATRKKFTSGTTRDNITAINTALGHLGTLWKDAQKLNNFGSPLVNAPINAVESGVLGDPRYTNFNLTRHAVVDELEKAFRGSGGTQTGIEEWKQGINSSQSPDQLRGAVGKAVELLDSRLQALGDAYATGMGRSADPMVFLNPHAKAVFGALGPGGDGNVPDLPKDFGGTPPVLGGNDNPPPPPPPSAPPSIGQGGGPQFPGGVPHADYSSLVGGPQQSLATMDPNSKLGVFQQTYRKAYDPVGAAALNALIHKGAPFEAAAAYAQSHGFNPPDPQKYAEAVAFAKTHPDTMLAAADRSVPTTLGERLASSPAAAFVAGGAAGATAGLSDTVGRTLAGPEWDANRAALSALNPGSDLTGNVAGGIAGSLALPSLVERLAPGLAAKTAALAENFPKAAPFVQDAAYGGTYGANENPNDPIMGALKGALVGGGGGAVARKATGGLANVIAPQTGNFGPLYKAGIFPTPGQRFGGSGLAGRMVNGVEQAMQSVPVLGAAPAAARQATRDAFQVGAFNNSLKELQPFAALGHDIPTALPSKVGPGTQAHSVTSDAFNKAYDTARSGMQFVPDAQYALDTKALLGKLGDGHLSGEQAHQVQQRIGSAVESRLANHGGDYLNGDAYKAASADIGRTIDSWSRDPAKSDMANALSEYQSIFDNAARRSSDPTAVNLLDAADKGYAQFVRIQRASQMGGAAKDAGTFTPVNYAGAVKQTGGGVRSNAYSRGNALGQDYAQAGLNLRDTLADSGTATRLGVLGGLQATEGAGLAATHNLGLLLNPKMIGAFAPYLPGVREATNRLIAPREFTLPPALADPLNLTGAKLNQIAPFIGKAAVPGSLAYMGYAQ